MNNAQVIGCVRSAKRDKQVLLLAKAKLDRLQKLIRRLEERQEAAGHVTEIFSKFAICGERDEKHCVHGFVSSASETNNHLQVKVWQNVRDPQDWRMECVVREGSFRDRVTHHEYNLSREEVWRKAKEWVAGIFHHDEGCECLGNTDKKCRFCKKILRREHASSPS